jgi:hypothetical protein
MRRFIPLSIGCAALALVVAHMAPARGDTARATEVYPAQVPAKYRDWRFVSVAREEGAFDDIRAILGNDAAIQAYRSGKTAFPEGAMLARLAYSYEASEENNKVFGRRQSWVAGQPKNGVQFMIKDSKKYAATGGWGYAQFNDGKLIEESKLKTCFACHQAAVARDFVFTRYAP